MKNNDNEKISLPVKLFERISFEAADAIAHEKRYLAKLCVSLPDRPGSLADFARLICNSGGNITFFHYDRSVDSSRVVAESAFDARSDIETLLASLKAQSFVIADSRNAQYEVNITEIENILEVKVRLENHPGTLATFAEILKDHGANVIHMLYDEDIDPERADITMATVARDEITSLLDEINAKGYYYRVIYSGGGAPEVTNIIGLKLAEKFFIRLRKLLDAGDAAEIRSLVESSRDLYADLVEFYREAGKNLEAGDVFEKVLALASRSRTQVGKRFTAREMPPITLDNGLTVMGLRLPTSENIYIINYRDEAVIMDAGHGVYYEDIKDWLRAKSIEPASIGRMFISHPDTDHIGCSGYFEREFGTEIHMHRGAVDVMENMNRAHGVTGRLLNLNKYYTRLSSRFTECRFPEKPFFFTDRALGDVGGLRHIDSFTIGPLEFMVIESMGGHAPGQVFFLNQPNGLLFTSDFLIDIPSLSQEEREHLGLYRYLLTTPNSNSQLYGQESAALKGIIASIDTVLIQKGRRAIILPGHGAYYSPEPSGAA